MKEKQEKLEQLDKQISELSVEIEKKADELLSLRKTRKELKKERDILNNEILGRGRQIVVDDELALKIKELSYFAPCFKGGMKEQMFYKMFQTKYGYQGKSSVHLSHLARRFKADLEFGYANVLLMGGSTELLGDDLYNRLEDWYKNYFEVNVSQSGKNHKQPFVMYLNFHQNVEGYLKELKAIKLSALQKWNMGDSKGSLDVPVMRGADFKVSFLIMYLYIAVKFSGQLKGKNYENLHFFALGQEGLLDELLNKLKEV